MNKIINSAWFGPPLTNIQKLCIQSYLDNGHEFHLYVLDPIEGVPEGTVIRNANELFSKDRMKMFAHNAHAADVFRILLIQKIGGWWVDLDTICLKPFDFSEEYAFVSESQFGPRLDPRIHTRQCPASEEVQPYVSNAIFKAPANAPVFDFMIQEINKMDTLHLETWVSIASDLFKKALSEYDLLKYVKPPVIFDGMNYNEIYMFVWPGISWRISPKSYALHLRTSCWLGPNFMCPPYGDRDIPVFLDPDGTYAEDSLFEILKRKHGVA